MPEESHADARDMFVVHRMFRREFGLMPGLVRAVVPLIEKYLTQAEYLLAPQESQAALPRTSCSSAWA